MAMMQKSLWRLRHNTAWFSESLASSHAEGSPAWPQTGLSVTVTLIIGYRPPPSTHASWGERIVVFLLAMRRRESSAHARCSLVEILMMPPL